MNDSDEETGKREKVNTARKVYLKQNNRLGMKQKKSLKVYKYSLRNIIFLRKKS